MEENAELFNYRLGMLNLDTIIKNRKKKMS